MKRLNHISVHDVRMNYHRSEKAKKDRELIWVYYVLRPISFYPTALFLKLGISANQTTWISVIVLCLGCLLLAVGDYVGAIVGALLVNAWLVLDAVDGLIARYRKSSSLYGEFIDALGGYLAYLLFLAVGVGGYLHPERLLISRLPGALSEVDAAVVLILGAWSSFTALWIRLVYHKFKNTFQDTKVHRYDIAGVRSGSSPLGTVLKLGNNLFNLGGLLLPALLIAVATKAVGVFLLICAAANTAMLLFSLARLLSRAAEYTSITRAD